MNASTQVLPRTHWHVMGRVSVALVGGYATAAALASTLPVALVAAGLARVDAVTIASMLAVVVDLLLGLWVFAARSMRAPAIALGVGTLGWLALLALPASS